MFETEKKLKNNPIYRKDENEKIISITILYQINPKDYKYGLPFDGYDRIFLYKFQTLYEVLINSLDKYEYGSFEKAVDSLFSCLNKYFSYIDNHIIVVDNVFFDFIETSNKIIDKIKKLENKLYSDIFINCLSSFIKELYKYNIFHDTYYQKIVELYFEKILVATNDFVIGSNRIITIIPIFSNNNKLLRCSFDTFIKYLSVYQEALYKKNDSLNKTMINKIINVFTFEILTNQLYLYEDNITDSIFKLQEKIDVNNIYTPLPGQGLNDFSISIEPGDNDKTLSSIVKKTLPYYINEIPNIKPLRYINILKQIIQILIKRYNKGGTHKNGIQDQLYCIFFHIFTLLDSNTFHFIYQTPITFISPKDEKDSLMKLLLYIIEFESDKNNFMKDYFLSELKFLFILVSKINAVDYIQHNKKLFIKIILNNKKIDYKFKIAVYSFYKTLLPKKNKLIFCKHIKKLYKRNRLSNEFLPFEERNYDVTKINMTYLNIPFPLESLFYNYINQTIFAYLPYKKKKIKKAILDTDFPCSIGEMYKRFPTINSIFINGIISELVSNYEVVLDSDNYTLIRKV